LAIVFLSVRGVPRFCRPLDSVRAVGYLVRGEDPEKPPPGSLDEYRPYKTWAGYSWGEDKGVREYLRTATRPTTRVANMLRVPPFLALNGPVGRISPFPAESGILWLWQVDPDIEDAFVRELETTTDCVVVWDSNERSFTPALQLPRLVATIRRHYAFETRFGRVEVWRRKADDAGARRSQ
jgi:hypothetical protein